MGKIIGFISFVLIVLILARNCVVYINRLSLNSELRSILIDLQKALNKNFKDADEFQKSISIHSVVITKLIETEADRLDGTVLSCLKEFSVYLAFSVNEVSYTWFKQEGPLCIQKLNSQLKILLKLLG